MQEEFVDTLEMWPGWFDLIFLFHTGFGELEVGFLEVGEWPKDVLLNHGHNIVQMGDDQTNDCLLVLKQLLNFVDGIQSFGLALDIL